MPNQTRDLHTVDKDSFSYIFEQNATVPLKSSDGLVRVNVYRPNTEEKVPVLVTYGPYGKDIAYAEYGFKSGNSLKSANPSLQLPRQVFQRGEPQSEIRALGMGDPRSGILDEARLCRCPCRRKRDWPESRKT